MPSQPNTDMNDLPDNVLLPLLTYLRGPRNGRCFWRCREVSRRWYRLILPEHKFLLDAQNFGETVLPELPVVQNNDPTPPLSYIGAFFRFHEQRPLFVRLTELSDQWRSKFMKLDVLDEWESKRSLLSRVSPDCTLRLMARSVTDAISAVESAALSVLRLHDGPAISVNLDVCLELSRLTAAFWTNNQGFHGRISSRHISKHFSIERLSLYAAVEDYDNPLVPITGYDTIAATALANLAGYFDISQTPGLSVLFMNVPTAEKAVSLIHAASERTNYDTLWLKTLWFSPVENLFWNAAATTLKSDGVKELTLSSGNLSPDWLSLSTAFPNVTHLSVVGIHCAQNFSGLVQLTSLSHLTLSFWDVVGSQVFDQCVCDGSLPGLQSVSLSPARRISSDGFVKLLKFAPSLKSLDLKVVNELALAELHNAMMSCQFGGLESISLQTVLCSNLAVAEFFLHTAPCLTKLAEKQNRLSERRMTVVLQRVKNVATTLRNHWKKSTFGVVCLFFGGRFANQKYEERQILRHYALLAKEFGSAPIDAISKPRRVTVLLNPLANEGKGKTAFEKHALPLLHLAGLQVDLTKPVDATQLEEIASLIDEKDTDCVLIVGGDGSISRVITGLMRDDQKSTNKRFLPIGVFPGGKRSLIAELIFPKQNPRVRWHCEAAMAVIRERTQKAHVLKLELLPSPISATSALLPELSDASVTLEAGASETTSKEPEADREPVPDHVAPVYGLGYLHWGPFRNVEDKKFKYWYWGGLKSRFAYVWSLVRGLPVPCAPLNVEFVAPCAGCSRCHVAAKPKLPAKRWWNLFIGSHRYVDPHKETATDYSKLVNDDCGKVESCTLNSTVEVTLKNEMFSAMPAIFSAFGPETIAGWKFVREGWKRSKFERPISSPTQNFYQKAIRAREITFSTANLPLPSWATFCFDGEPIETSSLESVKVSLLPRMLDIYTHV